MKEVQLNIKNMQYNQLKSLVNQVKLDSIPITINIQNLFKVTEFDVTQEEVNLEYKYNGI